MPMVEESLSSFAAEIVPPRAMVQTCGSRVPAAAAALFPFRSAWPAASKSVPCPTPVPAPVTLQPIPAVRHEPVVQQDAPPVEARAEGDDIASQISELKDLFPGKRDGDPGSMF